MRLSHQHKLVNSFVEFLFIAMPYSVRLYFATYCKYVIAPFERKFEWKKTNSIILDNFKVKSTITFKIKTKINKNQPITTLNIITMIYLQAASVVAATAKTTVTFLTIRNIKVKQFLIYLEYF